MTLKPVDVPRALALVLVVVGVSSSAYADFVEPNTFVIGEYCGMVTRSYGDFSCADTIGGIGESTTVSLGYTSLSTKVDGVVTVSGNADVSTGFFQSNLSVGQGLLIYYVGVVGDRTGYAPIVVHTKESVSVLGLQDQYNSTIALASVQLHDSLGNAAISKACDITYTNPNCDIPSSGGDLYGQVLINAVAGAFVTIEAGGNSQGGSYVAKADPMVEFAPGFDSTGLSLVFSPGPVSGVPEPSSLPLLVTVVAVIAGCRGYFPSGVRKVLGAFQTHR